MYILKNAWKSIVRNKGRNILIMLIAFVIAVASCISLSIRQAAQTAKESTLSNMSITAQITFDRSSLMGQMTQGQNRNLQTGGGFNRGDFDFSALSGQQLTIDDYMEYAGCLTENDGYYYTVSVSLNATGDILPYGEEETDENDEQQSESENGWGLPGFGDDIGGKLGFGNRGDFSVTGYSSYSAMLSLFGEDGTHTISSGEMFDETAEALTCVISDELALYNNLSVGDVLTLANPQYEEETYDITISGIYTNSASSEGNSIFAASDPANNIYMNSYALQTVIDASKDADHKTTNSQEEEVSAALSGELSFSYLFSGVENYEAFEAAVSEKLPENYTISSPDVEGFEKSLTPLNTLSTMTGWFFIIVLLVGGVILIVFNIFNLRDRKYEVGVLTAIGMKKDKVALQFITELFIVTFAAIIIGTGIGAVTSIPITNALLEGQIESSQESNEKLQGNFGFENGDGKFGGNMGPGMGLPGGMEGFGGIADFDNIPEVSISYVDSVSSATNLTVVWQLILVGILLTILSGSAAMITIMRYEPLRILSDRS